MGKINLAITGCMGRMGQQLIKSALKDKSTKKSLKSMVTNLLSATLFFISNAIYKNPSSNCASSLIRSLDHGGSNVISISTSFT